jgi:hypothetical protein
MWIGNLSRITAAWLVLAVMASVVSADWPQYTENPFVVPLDIPAPRRSRPSMSFPLNLSLNLSPNLPGSTAVAKRLGERLGCYLLQVSQSPCCYEFL